MFQINQIYEYVLGKFIYKIVHNCFPGFNSCCYAHIYERHNYPSRITTNNDLTTTSSTISPARRSTQYTGRRLSNNINKEIIPSVLSNIQKILTGSSYAVIYVFPVPYPRNAFLNFCCLCYHVSLEIIGCCCCWYCYCWCFCFFSVLFVHVLRYLFGSLCGLI